MIYYERVKEASFFMKKYRHIIELNNREEAVRLHAPERGMLSEEVRNWLMDNVGPIAETWLYGAEDNSKPRLYFLHKDDAMRFKLTWGGNA